VFVDWRSWLRRWSGWGWRRVRRPPGPVRPRPRPRLGVLHLEDRLAPAAPEPTFRGGLTVASSDITGDGLPDLVGAPGPGVTPTVVAYDGATGDPVTSFLPFEPDFRGGVFVAAGDVTGDGLPEVVVGAGAGGGPRVVVLDPRTGRQLASFFAYDPGFRGGVRVAVADLGEDGTAEVVTAPGEGGGPHVRAFDAAGRSLGRDLFAYADDFRGGVSLAAGDADGDGAADIVTAPGSGGAAHVKVFDGPTGAVLESYFASDPAARGGAWVAAADVDGNGTADVVVGAGEGADPVVRVFSAGTAFAGWGVYEPSFRGGVRVAAADLNGDAFADILTGPADGGGPRVTIWDGFAFTRTASFFGVTDGRPLGFSTAAPPPRSPLFDGRTLLVPGTPGGRVDLAADLLRRLNDTRGEVGLYPVDDPAGTVGGLAPGTGGTRPPPWPAAGGSGCSTRPTAPGRPPRSPSRPAAGMRCTWSRAGRRPTRRPGGRPRSSRSRRPTRAGPTGSGSARGTGSRSRTGPAGTPTSTTWSSRSAAGTSGPTCRPRPPRPRRG
jgi:hypothetical protein